MDENDDGYISYEEWIHFNTAHPDLLESWRSAMPQVQQQSSFFQRIPAWVQIPAVIALFWLAGRLRQSNQSWADGLSSKASAVNRQIHTSITQADLQFKDLWGGDGPIGLFLHVLA